MANKVMDEIIKVVGMDAKKLRELANAIEALAKTIEVLNETDNNHNNDVVWWDASEGTWQNC